MPIQDSSDDQLVNIRTISGIDWADDARISNPGAYFILQNLWSRNTSGLAAKRPGSTLLVDGRNVVSLTGSSTSPLGAVQAGGIPCGTLTAISTNPAVLPAGTITATMVSLQTGFAPPTSGQFYLTGFVQTTGGTTPQLITYTGLTYGTPPSLSFTGCTGGTGTLIGSNVAAANAQIVLVTPVTGAQITQVGVVNQGLLPTGVGSSVVGSGGSIIPTAVIAQIGNLITNPKLLGARGTVPKVNL